MAGFILNYGTEAGGHVEIDRSEDSALYLAPPNAAGEYADAWTGTPDEFFAAFPDVAAEMVRNGALRQLSVKTY